MLNLPEVPKYTQDTLWNQNTKKKNRELGLFLQTWTFYWLIMCLCGLGSPCALLLDHNRLLALQNSAGTTQGSLGTQIRTTVKHMQRHTWINLRQQICLPSWSPKWSEIMWMWAHHAQVLPVLVLADNVPHTVEGGTGVLVDGDLLIRGSRFVLTCAAMERFQQHGSWYQHTTVLLW